MRAATRELIDGPVESHRELEQNFRDIERFNRYFGGRAVRRAVAKKRPQTIADVGCGTADIARALLRDARSRRETLGVTCIDANAAILALARTRSGTTANIEFVLSDGRQLPLADGAVDIAMCNLTLHHCDPPEAIALLRELRRVSKIGPLVSDLRRCSGAWIGATLASTIFSTNRLTRHDAPLSARRAYTIPEALELAQEAGWQRAAARKASFFRFLLTDD